MSVAPGVAESERRGTTVFWLVALAILAADVVTKLIVVRALPLSGPSIQVFGDFFRLRHIRNSGGLFGLFPGNAIYFAVVSVIAVVVILTVLHRSRRRDRLQQVALGLVLGGALGNLIDRLRLREVVDFLDVGIGAHRWPTFNVADSGVTIGVSLLVIWLLRSEAGPERSRASQEGGDGVVETEPRAVDRSS
jgi:signal peptidase II